VCNFTAELFLHLLSKLCHGLPHTTAALSCRPPVRNGARVPVRGTRLQKSQKRRTRLGTAWVLDDRFHLAASRCIVHIIVLYTIISLSTESSWRHSHSCCGSSVAAMAALAYREDLSAVSLFCFYLRGTSFQRYLARRHRIRFLAASFHYSFGDYI
jgi:hypothetical protein